jgi:FtsH-binding integral membrane protein
MNSYDSNSQTMMMTQLMHYMWFILAVSLFVIVCHWRIFTKAGKPGWACIIPIYNFIVLMEIIGKPWWWLLLMLIPLVNIVIYIMILNEISKSFGKGVGFTLGLLFLNIIFLPILAFGDAQYVGPGGRPIA